MNRRQNVLVCGLILVMSSACSYNRAYISYRDHDGDIPLSASGWEGVRLGKVSAKEGGPIWRECTGVAEGSIWVLLEETREFGGNAIGEIRWIPHNPDRISEEPTCKRRWGWFLVWPVLATHLFQTASVEAYAYRVEDAAELKEGMYLVPESLERRELIVEAILGDSLGSASQVAQR